MTNKTISLKKDSKEKPYSDNRYDPYVGKTVVVSIKSPSVVFGELVYVGKQHIRVENADEYVLINGEYKTFATFPEMVIEKQGISTFALWDRDDLPQLIMSGED